MADESVDRKPMRPQSTAAQDLSAQLESAWGINREKGVAQSVGQIQEHENEAELGDLSQTVEQKKQDLSLRNRELEEIEQRLRATEERLKERQKTPEPSAASVSSDSRVGQPQAEPTNTRSVERSIAGDQSVSMSHNTQPPQSFPPSQHQPYSSRREQDNEDSTSQLSERQPDHTSHPVRSELPRQDSEPLTRMPGAFVKTPGDAKGRDYVESQRQ
ncbi:MAG: hypothetical protein M1817_002528 [Caeruleum heppii]|nr:MAG: hypothetical protein M1817_002528 [Caeruleum heppii]